MLEQVRDRLGQAGGVVAVDQHAGLPVHDQLGEPSHAAGDERTAARGRFHAGGWESL
jgi:hypothetical protein